MLDYQKLSAEIITLLIPFSIPRCQEIMTFLWFKGMHPRKCVRCTLPNLRPIQLEVSQQQVSTWDCVFKAQF